jgi:hypothetical protein
MFCGECPRNRIACEFLDGMTSTNSDADMGTGMGVIDVVANTTMTNNSTNATHSEANALQGWGLAMNVTLSLSLTILDHNNSGEECLLSLAEQATFCEGVRQGAGVTSLLNLKMSVVDIAILPMCEVMGQECINIYSSNTASSTTSGVALSIIVFGHLGVMNNATKKQYSNLQRVT